MKQLVIIPLLAAVAGMAQAQGGASPEETEIVSKIVGCLVEGAPADWQRLFMVVELDKPGDETGGVRYLVTRAGAAEGAEPFKPCDLAGPARVLLEVRESQSPERRNWIAARLVFERDGRFTLNYDYRR